MKSRLAPTLPFVLKDAVKLEALAGQGAMGSVYRGVDLRTGQRVAVKLVSDGLSDKARSRFEREALTLRDVSHPNVVRYIEHGTSPLGDYLVMEWMAGASLRERLGLGAFDPLDLVGLARGLVLGLGALAQHGIVHRDLKPDNIMLRQGDLAAPVLVDLGIARAAHGLDLTGKDAMLGTPHYMAPEQIRSPSQVDARADVFSLGCVLFECVAGRPPFDDPDPITVISRMLLDRAPSLRTFAPTAPAALVRWVDALLARAREDRPSPDASLVASLDVLAAELASHSSLEGEGVAPATGMPDVVPSSALRADFGRAGERDDPLAFAATFFDAAVEAAADVEAKASGVGSAGATELFLAKAPTLRGRSQELDMSQALLSRDRMCILWGPPGVGKTRIAQELASRAQARSLAIQVVDACSSIDAALLELGTSRAGASAFWQAREPSLVVFDGADAIIDELVALLQEWCARSLAVQFLCTSRVAPKSSVTSLATVQGLDEASAAELFVDAAKRDTLDGAAPLDPHDPAVRAVVRALEGNPLALRLAGSRYPILGLDGLLRSGSAWLEVLEDGDARMVDAIDASWRLLDPETAATLAAASLLAAPFAFADLRACVPQLTDQRVMSAVEQAQRHALLSSQSLGPKVVHRLSPSVLEYARAALRRSGQEMQVENLIADHLLRTLSPQAVTFAHTGRAEALASLVAAANPVDLALGRAVMRGDASRALRLALLLEPVWAIRGAVGFALARLEEVCSLSSPLVLASGASKEDVAAHMSLVQARGRLLGLLGRFDEANVALQDVLAFAQSLPFALQRAEWQQGALVDRAVLAHLQRKNAEARALYRESLALRVGEGTRAEGRAVANLGALYHDEGDTHRARLHYAEAAALLEAVGDARQAGICVGNLAVLDVESGRWDDAHRRFEQALQWLRRAGDLRLIGITTANAGMFWLERRQAAYAVRLLEEAKRLLALVGDLRSEALALGRLAAALALAGRPVDASTCFMRAERLAGNVDALTQEAVHAQGMLLDLAEAHHALAQHDQARAEQARTRAEARRRRVTLAGADQASPAAQSDDVRAALRVAQSAFAMLGPEAAS